MNSLSLHIIKIINFYIPETRFFGFKKFMYNFAGAKIGKNVRICSSAKISGNGALEIGDNNWIGPEVMIVSSSQIKIGANVDIAPRVYIGTGTHVIDYEGIRSAGQGLSMEVNIENGSWIGAGAFILPGITVGAKAIVAAGAVVSKNVTEKTMVGGVPARFIKDLGII
ncbi:MAG: acyltransferase [Flavobacteriales bacterium]|nr:acyltransferase [Flavobacteriales bacterium]